MTDFSGGVRVRLIFGGKSGPSPVHGDSGGFSGGVSSSSKPESSYVRSRRRGAVVKPFSTREVPLEEPSSDIFLAGKGGAGGGEDSSSASAKERRWCCELPLVGRVFRLSVSRRGRRDSGRGWLSGIGTIVVLSRLPVSQIQMKIFAQLTTKSPLKSLMEQANSLLELASKVTSERQGGKASSTSKRVLLPR